MKMFLAGIVVGLGLPAMFVVAQQHAKNKIVQPQLLIENEKVRIVRWTLEPGESSPVHPHQLDHISVVLRGSMLRDTPEGGSAKPLEQKTAAVSFNPGPRPSHSFANMGKTTFESVSIELKH